MNEALTKCAISYEIPFTSAIKQKQFSILEYILHSTFCLLKTIRIDFSSGKLPLRVPIDARLMTEFNAISKLSCKVSIYAMVSF